MQDANHCKPRSCSPRSLLCRSLWATPHGSLPRLSNTDDEHRSSDISSGDVSGGTLYPMGSRKPNDMILKGHLFVAVPTGDAARTSQQGMFGCMPKESSKKQPKARKDTCALLLGDDDDSLIGHTTLQTDN